MQCEGNDTARCVVSELEDLQRNTKTLMYPKNVLSTQVVTILEQGRSSMQAGYPSGGLRYTERVWAPSTMKDRRCLMERFVKFRKEQGQVDTIDMAAAVVATVPDVILSSRKTYAVHLAGNFRELQIPCPTLSMMRRGMVALGANIASPTKLLSLSIQGLAELDFLLPVHLWP